MSASSVVSAHDIGIASREYFTKAYLRPLMETVLIARADPDHPNSPRQKYALTTEGGAVMRTNVYCGNLLWQSSLTLFVPAGALASPLLAAVGCAGTHAAEGLVLVLVGLILPFAAYLSIFVHSNKY